MSYILIMVIWTLTQKDQGDTADKLRNFEDELSPKHVKRSGMKPGVRGLVKVPGLRGRPQ